MTHEESSAESRRRSAARGIDGRFELKELLGRGGMGTVWRAHDPTTGRDLALKLLAVRPDDPERRERFRREAELTARLQHPAIVRVYAQGETGDGRPWIAYELVEGARTLREAFPGLPRRRRIELVRDVARALAHAHARGVVHRDVKAENLLLADGRVRVADFGLALATDQERLTRTGALVGTLGHMAPEQLSRSALPGPTADVWALGVLLYEALVDLPPFEAGTLAETAARVQAAAPVPPRKLDRSVPADLEAVVARALSRDPAGRYPEAGALAGDLERWLAGERTQASTTGAVRPPRGRLLLVGAAGLLGPLLVLVFLLLSAGRADPEAVRARGKELLRAAGELLSAEALAAEQGPRLAGLAREARDLEAQAASAGQAGETELRGTRARLEALQGLIALERGDVAAATSALRRIEEEPLRDPGAHLALRGALLTAAGDPARGAIDLRHAREEGVGLLDLRVDEGLALLRAGEVAPERAEAALKDLARVRVRRERAGLPAQPASVARELELEVLALLALGRLDPAEALLSRADAAPEHLAWLVTLARVQRALELADPTVARELLRSATPPKERPPAAREAEWRLAGEAGLRAERLLVALRHSPLDTAQFGHVLHLLFIAERLRPGQRVAQDNLSLLLERGLAYAAGKRLGGEQLAALAELFPDEASVQEAVALHAGRLGGSDKARLLPAIRRAFELAREPDKREALGVNLVRSLVHQELLEECLEVCERLAGETAWSEEARGAVRVVRAEAWAKRRVWDAAWTDLQRAEALDPGAPLRYPLLWARVLRGLGRGVEAFERAASALEDEPAGEEVDSGSRDEALVLVWELGRAEGPRVPLEAALEAFAERNPSWSGWWARLALVRLERGASGPAAEALRHAAAGALRRGDRLQVYSAGWRRLADDIEARGQALLSELRAQIDQLERLRGRSALP